MGTLFTFNSPSFPIPLLIGFYPPLLADTWYFNIQWTLQQLPDLFSTRRARLLQSTPCGSMHLNIVVATLQNYPAPLFPLHLPRFHFTTPLFPLINTRFPFSP